jgi:hypothetical protein
MNELYAPLYFVFANDPDSAHAVSAPRAPLGRGTSQLHNGVESRAFGKLFVVPAGLCHCRFLRGFVIGLYRAQIASFFSG